MQKYKKFILFSCALTVAFCAFVLLYGWGMLAKVISHFAGGLPMAMDSAACFITISLSLSLLLSETGKRGILSGTLALIVFSWCSLMLVRDFTSIHIALTFGMSPQTAFCFACLSSGIFLMRVVKHKYLNLVQALFHIVSFISGIAIIGHYLDIPEFYRMTFIPMAIYAALGFMLLSVSASLVHPKKGITAVFTGELIGNLMARKLFFRLLLAILIIGYIRIQAHRYQWISTELSIAVLITVFIIISLVLIWITSASLNLVHVKQKIAEENFKIAVDAAPYAIIIADSTGSIATVNDRTRDLYGYQKREMLGRNAKMLLPQLLHDEFDAKVKEFYSTNDIVKISVEREVHAIKKDGSEFPVEVIFTPVKTALQTYLLATIIDITERKKQEETIRKQLIELQVKNEELEQFNYITSHDLQEPLRTMSNYIHLIEEDYGDRIDGEVKSHLGTMGASIGRMSHIVKSLLSYGKLGRKRKLVPTDCNEVMDDVTADLGNMISTNNAKINIACRLPECYAYKTELRQLFQNLVANAIKFRKQDAHPEVEINNEKKGDYYEFSVSDNGIGIDPKDHDKIFRIFHKLNTDDAYEGHGIGLANCKKIVEMHGGRIWVESEPGKGSTFKFTILNLQNE